jgi:hypothetical protein
LEKRGRWGVTGVNAAEAAITLIAFAVLRHLGAIADTPLWVYCALLGGGAVSTAVAL